MNELAVVLRGGRQLVTMTMAMAMGMIIKDRMIRQMLFASRFILLVQTVILSYCAVPCRVVSKVSHAMKHNLTDRIETETRDCCR